MVPRTGQQMAHVTEGSMVWKADKDVMKVQTKAGRVVAGRYSTRNDGGGSVQVW